MEGMCSNAKSCVKGAIVFINIIILLAGAAALGVGLWVLLDENSFMAKLYPYMEDLEIVDKDVLKHAAIVLASGGAATICFALLGISAACTGCSWLMGIYISVVVVVIAVEVATLVLGIIFKREWEDKIDNEMTQRIKTEYNQKPNAYFVSTFDSLQKSGKCCGWKNGSDYSIDEGSPFNQNNGTTVVPPSCCKMHNVTYQRENCTTVPSEENSYLHQGCKHELHNIFDAYQGSIIGLSGGIAGVEFLLLILSIILISSQDSNKYAMS